MTTAGSSSVKVFTKIDVEKEVYFVKLEPVLNVKTSTFYEDDPSLTPLQQIDISVNIYVLHIKERKKIKVSRSLRRRCVLTWGRLNWLRPKTLQSRLEML